MRRRTGRMTVGILMACGAMTAVALAAPSNGGFEKGTFKNWHRVDKSSGAMPRDTGTGAWQIYKGELRLGRIDLRGGGGEPRRPRIEEPPQGEYAAGMASQGPGFHILHRVLEAKGKSKLSLQLAYNNTAEDFASPDSFNTEGGSNQQIRIDLLKPNAPTKSLEDADIIDTIFRTRPGDKRKSGGYSKITTKVGDGKFRLRIAEVDNMSNMLVGVDAVKLIKE